jgi:hypothetical protein
MRKNTMTHVHGAVEQVKVTTMGLPVVSVTGQG